MLDIEARRTDPARIAVIGLGGGGSNAVNRMIDEGLRHVTFWVANTDAQALEGSACPNRLQLGATLTGGLGAGGDPSVGRAAAEEDANAITEILEGFDMVFVTAGMGGGTGTGAAPVVARIARSLGALTVAVVTRPFSLEAARRSARAEEGVRQLGDEVDTLIVIPNDKLLHLVDRTASFDAGLRVADGVLYQATRGIADIVSGNGLINVDFADVRTVMKNRGAALLGCGVANGANRASDAAQAAVSSPLLEDLSIQGAEAVLVNIVGGPDMGFHEVTEAAKYITEQAGKDCDVFLGAVVDPNLTAEMRVTLIATGFQRAPAIRKVERPVAAARPAPAVATTAPVLAPMPYVQESIPVAAAAPVIEEPAALPPLVPTRVVPLEPIPAAAMEEESIWAERLEPETIPEADPWAAPRVETPPAVEDPERWIEETPGGESAPGTDRAPALWRRRPARRLSFPERLGGFRRDARDQRDTPTFYRKQMD
jgi:cell division protein FtsZ